MEQKLVFVADLGRLKAYRLDDNPEFSHPRMQLLGDWETDAIHHLSEGVSDQNGQYRKAVNGHSAVLSDGENHNLELERRRRAVRTLAHHITELVGREKASQCYLAADARIHQPILDKLDARTKAAIQKSVLADLSKVPADQIMGRFQVVA